MKDEIVLYATKEEGACMLPFTHWVILGNGRIRGYIENYLPEDPHFDDAPFGMRLENGNFMWCPLSKIEKIGQERKDHGIRSI